LSAYLIILTISAFSLGDIQHAMTASHDLATYTNTSLCFIIPLNANASITIALFLCSCLNQLFSSNNSGVNKSKACYSLCTSHTCISGARSLHANPMFLAVSNLSPVSIHTLIWASLNDYIVSGTLSCNLSSTLVAPSNVNSYSSSSNKVSYNISLSSIFWPAS